MVNWNDRRKVFFTFLLTLMTFFLLGSLMVISTNFNVETPDLYCDTPGNSTCGENSTIYFNESISFNPLCLNTDCTSKIYDNGSAIIIERTT